MNFLLYFSEHNSFQDQNATRSTEVEFEWYENEYEIPFTAKTLKEAQAIARDKCDSSSGVFNVYDRNKQQLIFTEETAWKLLQ